MPDKVRLHHLFFAALLAIFLLGMTRLFVMRFEAGDIYPRYSSLRADPLGAKALFESLGRLKGRSVRRNHGPLDRLLDDPAASIYFLGAQPGAMRNVTAKQAGVLEDLAAGGGRLVFSFHPDLETRSDPADEEDGGEDTGKGDGKDMTDSRGVERVDLTRRWGFSFSHSPPDAGGEDIERLHAYRADDGRRPLALEELVPSRSWLALEDTDGEWKTIYRREGHPVIMERSFGRGSIVLSSDTYYLSNEALQGNRRPGLLTWTAGDPGLIIFDETHLGVALKPGVASLIRRYRLHGFVFGLALLAGLFVWKSTAGFLPPYREGSPGPGPVQTPGRDSHSAFVNLLRRNIHPRELLRACLGEWEISFPQAGKEPGQRVERARETAGRQDSRPAGAGDPLEGYRKITRTLKGEERE